ncbi:hypothetical protein BKA70DRAFT_1447502 [Coprinopsis sp. MPI-PUGE-AT-0042]|nr:hypothetical protein BKA70DRAFT_1447502 [Coprinopsis sp. MPI-PUGE-AT-0042]
MSLAISTTSRALPRCRTCREPMRGHPRTDCARSKSNSTAQPKPSTAETESASCIPNENDLIAEALRPAFGIPDGNATVSTLKAEHTGTSTLGRSARTIAKLRFRQPQQSTEQTPPTIEDMIAFLLGVHHPVDPARVRFALSLLDELEGASDIKDEDCAPGHRRSHSQYATQGSKTLASSKACPRLCTYGLKVTNGLDLPRSDHSHVRINYNLRNTSKGVSCLPLLITAIDMGYGKDV